jgi:hypothetical protein
MAILSGMKVKLKKRLAFGSLVTGTALVIFACAALQAGAQNATAVSLPPPAGALWTPDALDQILKPIALYPDPLLAGVFTAATLPSQIVLPKWNKLIIK